MIHRPHAHFNVEKILTNAISWASWKSSFRFIFKLHKMIIKQTLNYTKESERKTSFD